MRTRRIDHGGASVLVTESDDVTVARGIRYATAERFAAPQVVRADAGLIDATARGPACPQLPSRLEFATGPVIGGLRMSEHCQVLSVTAPSGADRLPVMVWFHGGAYVSGGGESPKYDPHALAAEGQVVVVTVTYRLGIFGYLNLHDRRTQNLGLRDQLCALRWVRDHIAAFGGDPARVTIFGQSAGGDSVLALMLCEESAGLFTRAVLHSAPLGLRSDRSELTAAMRDAAMTSLGGVPALEADVAQLLDAQVTVAKAAQRFGRLGLMPFAPTVGMAPLPPAGEIPARLADAASRIEILVGYTRDDGRPFVAMDPRGRRLRRLGPPGALLAASVGRNLTKHVFGCPAIEFADTWVRAGGRSATFRVDWAPPQAPLGACHCIDLPLLLGSPQAWADAPMLGPTPHPIDGTLGRRMRALWGGFARDGVDALGPTPLTIG
ncbi:carboxylesterase type B [Mycolicibacterium canariasense]|uniref:Carboxylic ester hydrolase n=1 Tax=Mycolicibacterium canariasense TaxID=228230 RepID=A0A100WJ22_MYCCR|nr:carboxylesterase family protein [Mycolicibacterium canariasense]MCV7208035.1 carboxylesterase family protein [Mycolicibacterium canariasense]ORV11102.1 para-nitrobenzyl esterase [Mycolicibacterium canariasense]GAS99222.1 carboxylesterase type B [Mycolicibacterium canariasense]